MIKIFLFLNKETVFSCQFSMNSIKASSTKILVFLFSQTSTTFFMSSNLINCPVGLFGLQKSNKS